MSISNSESGTLLSVKEAARILNVSVAVLQLWRSKKYGPAYLKIGRLIKYFEIDLIEWLKSCHVTHVKEVNDKNI